MIRLILVSLMLLNSSHNYAQEEKSFKIAVSSKGMLVLDQLSSGVSCKWSESSDLENYDEIRLLKQMPIGCALSESENAVFFCEKFQHFLGKVGKIHWGPRF